MHILFGLVFGVFGLAVGEFILMNGVVWGLMGAVIGIMGAELIALRSRVNRLEAQQGEAVRQHPGPEERATDSEQVRVEKAQEQPMAAPPEPAPLPLKESVPERMVPEEKPVVPHWYDRVYEAVVGFFTGGNLVLKAGVIVFFFGIAFLLKYAVQHSMISEELRLCAAAGGAVVLLLVGWRLRKKRAGYAVTIQGAGVGTLYLVIYAAAKLYHFLPVPMSLGLMVCLVALSSILAVLQDARSLAVFGALGGFAAPVLLSSGSGNHILLFSYFALLNVGVLIIAWFKSWRSLNLIGFVSTFVIGTLWGYRGYRPEHFATTEPFLIFFFLLYVAVAVLFAHRRPVRLKGVVDTTLVFGVPLAAVSLQYLLVRDTQYGMALSMTAVGILYLSLALLLMKRRVEGMNLLAESFLALGIAFGSLAIPFAADSKWTSAAWAMEGAALVWIGVRQKRPVGVLFGLLLQLGAGIGFIVSVWYPFEAVLFVNRHFIGCLLIAGAAMFSDYYLGEKVRDFKWKRLLRSVRFCLLSWGLLWWYYGGYREIDIHAPAFELSNGLLLYVCASIIALGMLAKRLAWKDLARSLLLLLPVMTLTMLAQLDRWNHAHFLSGWGAVAWPTAFIIQYRLLAHFEEMWPMKWAKVWHLVTMWLLLLLGCHEAEWAWSLLPEFASVWKLTVWGLVPGCSILVLQRWGTLLPWPVRHHESVYLGWGVRLPAGLLCLWVGWTFSIAGDPLPAPYIPLVNPLEMVQLFVLLVLFYRLVSKEECMLLGRAEPVNPRWILGALVFGWLTSVVARGVHFYHGVPYRLESLYDSEVLQASLAALWSCLALATTITATRLGNRNLWIAGSMLLALVVAKLFFIDLSGTGTIARIVSFLVVGILMLVIGYFAPLPPKTEEEKG